MPPPLPISSLQELSPEALAPFKDTLLAHLRARNTRARSPVDSNLHITRGERIPAYTFTLQALLETRSPTPENITKALSAVPASFLPADNVLPPPPPKNPGDVWQFASEERADFSPHHDTYFVRDTLQIRDCNECHQRGESGCKQCFGKGVQSCAVCLGAGHQQCVYCKGLERVTCLRCGGEGRLSAGGVQGASRVAQCDACGGKGKFPCTHCKEGKIQCAACRGSGSGPCAKCGGKGKVPCPLCGGGKKIVMGLAFEAEFKPAQVSASGLLVDGPREALDLALASAQPVGGVDLSSADSFEKQVGEMTVPPPLRTTLRLLVEKLAARLSGSTRAVKHKLDVAEGHVVRVSGYCAGQEFSFWMVEGRPDIVAEKDPLVSLSNSVAAAAEEAQAAGDWKKAVALARETLTYAPDHGVAQSILSDWRGRVTREVVGASLAAAVAAAVVFSAQVLGAARGLHKSGAVLQVSLWQFAVAAAAGGAMVPLLRRLTLARVRWAVLAGGLMAAHLGYAVLVHSVLDWNPVRSADQRALREEMAGHFRYGVPKIYYEPDLVFLRNLYDRYKDSWADVGPVGEELRRQQQLKGEHQEAQTLFESKVANILSSGDPVPRQRARLVELREYYKLLNLDVSAADEALKRLRAQASRPMVSTRNKTHRNSIVILSAPRRGAASTAAPKALPGKKSPAAPDKKTKKKR